MLIGLIRLPRTSWSQSWCSQSLGRALLSWFVQDPSHPLMRLLIDVTEPILAPIRNRLPSSWMIDLSPLIAIVVIQIVWRLIVSLATLQ